MVNIPDILGFEWDGGNQFKSFLKHGVSQKESEEVFETNPLITVKSEYKFESRFQAFGESKNGKLLIVIYTNRKNSIRIISARSQSKKERNFYHARCKEEKIKSNSGI